MGYTLSKMAFEKNYKNVLACRMHRFELDRHYDEIQWNNIDSVLFISEAMEEKFMQKETIGKNFCYIRQPKF